MAAAKRQTKKSGLAKKNRKSTKKSASKKKSASAKRQSTRTQAYRITRSKSGALKKGAVPRAKKGQTTVRKLNGTAIEWGVNAKGRRPSARKAYDSDPTANHIAVYGGHRYRLAVDKNGRPFWQK